MMIRLGGRSFALTNPDNNHPASNIAKLMIEPFIGHTRFVDWGTIRIGRCCWSLFAPRTLRFDRGAITDQQPTKLLLLVPFLILLRLTYGDAHVFFHFWYVALVAELTCLDGSGIRFDFVANPIDDIENL